MGLRAEIEAPSRDAVELERDEARQIQQSLLPVGPLKGATFEISYRFSPFSNVGGDFADFFTLPDGYVGLYVGDVVGKGLPAAMYAALVMGMLRSIHKTGKSTATALALLNKRLLVRPVAGRYAATLYALFNPVTRQLTFSNAGLPHPLLVSQSGCTQLGSGGFPSGLLPGATYDLHTVQLAAGDVVLFATDGLHELRDSNDQDFSWDKMGEIWRQCRSKSAEESLDFLFEGAKQFSESGRQHDDITAVVLKVQS
ncbi:MAG: PP2C family protein-serine/threonine phosphatase [Candidatus Acidiferrales bacterium]